MLEIPIEGMHCAHCAEAVARRLEQLGASRVAVDAGGGTAILQPGPLSRADIERVVTELGYRVPDRTESASPPRTDWKLAVAATFTLPLLLHMVLPIPVLHTARAQLLLSLPVVSIGLTHFGSSAWRSVRHGVASMDVLIVIGIAAAFFYSLAGILLGRAEEFLFFETAASITTFVLLGNFIERRSLKKTTSSIEELARLQPQTAKRVSSLSTLSQIEEIPAHAIRVGDLLQANSGDRIPTDGEVARGDALVDEALMSGESVPLHKREGDRVIGGAIVRDGALTIRATAIGDQTALQRIITLVRQATGSKPRIQRLGDRVSAVFVPAVLAFAFATFAISLFVLDFPLQRALLQSIAVLVIACPCAMGLATPTAVSVGVGRAARLGMLVKGGAILERLAEVRTVIFDKTGTVTTGRFRIAELKTFEFDDSHARSLIAAIERHSSHPIAQSIVRELEDAAPIELHSVREERGRGMHAEGPDGVSIRFGSRELTGAPEDLSRYDLYLCVDDRVTAALKIEDEIKSEVTAVIAALKGDGRRVILLSGDRADKVAATAAAIGVAEFHAQHSPESKLEFIGALSASAATAFVGDGINDAPALSRAGVGISLGDASQVAIQSADVVLLEGGLKHLPALFRLGSKTVTTIKQNLFWAFFYNVLAIPVAACGYLTPLVAALTMSFSDVIVIGNSLRLKFRSLK